MHHGQSTRTITKINIHFGIKYNILFSNNKSININELTDHIFFVSC